MNDAKVTVIIPACNEARTIGDIVSEIRSRYPDFEVIVVNDGSKDDTAAIAQDKGALVYSHPYTIGNGAAVKSGIRLASGEILVFMDGDGQHNPEDIMKMLKYFPDYDMVVGARSKDHQASLGRALGNWFYNRLASYVSKFSVEDLTSGFRAVKADVARGFLYLLPNTYSYPTTLTLCILRSGRSLKYVPINIQKRKEGKSRIRVFQDGVGFFLIITKICALYSPFRVFLPISFAMFCLGLGYYLYTFIVSSRFTNMSALLFTTSVIIFIIGLVSEQICQMRFERSEGDRFF
jgi:glycosyltransferase involved in cell wall biosynthesis